MFKLFKEELELGGKKLVLETGKIARQADGAIIATCGETVVISTVVGAKKVNPETVVCGTPSRCLTPKRNHPRRSGPARHPSVVRFSSYHRKFTRKMTSIGRCDNEKINTARHRLPRRIPAVPQGLLGCDLTGRYLFHQHPVSCQYRNLRAIRQFCEHHCGIAL